MPDPVLEAMDRFSGPLDELGKRQQRLLLAEYRAGWTSISGELEALTAKVAAAPRIPLISDGRVIQGIPPSWTFQQDRYIALQGEVRGLIGGMEQTLGTVTKAGQSDGWSIGGDEARAAGRNLAEIPISSWASVPQPAFQAFVGGATSGPLGPLLQSFAATNGPEAAVFARNVLGAGLLRGRSAFAIADDLSSGLQTISYSRALRIARTETLRAYREGVRQSYMANSQIVQSWVWRAAVENSKRPPCAACFAKHGSIHPVSETMSTHPNCRCRMVPRRSSILGITPNDPVLPDATKAFDALAPAQQRRILGPSRLEMYRSGRVTLPDFATSRARGPWGRNDATVRPLSELRSLSSQGRALPTASQRLFEASARGEAGVSAALQRIEFETGASLEGFAFRLKKTDRIAEKIATDVADGKGGIVKVTESLNDALRYTYKLTEKRYAAGVDEIMVAMQREGMTIVNTKNFWLAEGGGYRGFHAIMRAKDGTRFEMQFHTAQTLARKEPSHLLYEAQRLITTPAAEKARLQAQIDELWADVRRPRGVERIRQEWPALPESRLLTFTTEQEAISYYDDLYRKITPEKGTEFHDGLQDYTGGGFREVNRWRRGGDAALREMAEGEAASAGGVETAFEEMLARAKADIRTIERAMQPLPEDVIVHRGLRSSSPFGQLLVQSEEVALADRLAGLPKLVGQAIEERGYLSTAASPGGLANLSTRSVQFHITVPAGTRAAWLRPVSYYADENELLLESGLRYVISGARLEKSQFGPSGDIWHVDLTALPKAP